MLLVELLGDSGRQWLQYDRTLIGQGQWWRLLTCSYTHIGWWHWFLNELGFLVLLLLCPQPLSAAVWVRRMVLLPIAMALALYVFSPGLIRYVGMSGVLHGLFVLGLMPQVLKRDLISSGCLVYLLGKLGWEIVMGTPVSDEQAIGAPVALQSHLFGAIAGLVYGLVFHSYTRVETLRMRGSLA